ncbi:putative serine esterase Mb1866c [Oscarella lobularis]|uniref:putative serine esterase Mb1866c n=1 Tax=Oscarella lobularis TaxID=121494 RepID=UPI0033134F86
MKYAAIIAILAIGAAALWWRYSKLPCPSSDAGWFDVDAFDVPNGTFDLRTHAVTVDDGTLLALDTYIPSDWTPEKPPLPTIIQMTRYNRANVVRWPFSIFLGSQINVRSTRMIDYLVPRGYALVVAETRGSGASYGTRLYDLSPRERADFQEILKWIRAQPWCNGKKIGATGVSYDGVNALILAADAAGGEIKAVFADFFPTEMFESGAPGGVPCSAFVGPYLKAINAFETNVPFTGYELDERNWPPWWYALVAKYVVGGVVPVKEMSLDEALRNRSTRNWNATDAWRRCRFRDDVVFSDVDDSPAFGSLALGDASAWEKLIANDVAVAVYSGYYDLGFARGLVRVPERLNGAARLTLGPWVHGGYLNWSPFSVGTRPCFDFGLDQVRFFDYHLKGIDVAGFGSEKPVRYFTMGEEKWKSADAWPPRHDDVVYYFGNDFSLAKELSASTGRDEYDVDFGSSSGLVVRWSIVQQVYLRSNPYPDRAREDEALLVYTSPPLSGALVVTGSVHVAVHVEAVNATDLIVFAYLEDVDLQANTVTYVTEAPLRASHRCRSSSSSSTKCERSYTRADWRPLSGIELIEFDLLPVSYRFDVGHAFRLAFSGADDKNFDVSEFDVPLKWHVYWGGQYSSYVALPVE